MALFFSGRCPCPIPSRDTALTGLPRRTDRRFVISDPFTIRWLNDLRYGLYRNGSPHAIPQTRRNHYLLTVRQLLPIR